MIEDDAPAGEQWATPTMDVQMAADRFAFIRPADMGAAEAALFDAMASAATAAFNRMGQADSRDLTEAELRDLTRAGAEAVVRPLVEQVAGSTVVREALTHALAQEGMFVAAQLWHATFSGRPANPWGGCDA